jgi:hypothetical protein
MVGTRAHCMPGTLSTWAQRARSLSGPRCPSPRRWGWGRQPSPEGGGGRGRGAHLSLIRRDKDIPAAAAVPAAPLRPRRGGSVVPEPGSLPAFPPQVLPAATMTEGVLAADEVRVPLGASPPGPAAAAAGASPASPGAPGREAERGSGPGVSPPESPAAERGAELGADEEQPVPYPALAATVFFCLGQTTRPRSWCLRLVCNPYPFRADGARGLWAWDPLCVRGCAPRLAGSCAGQGRQTAHHERGGGGGGMSMGVACQDSRGRSGFSASLGQERMGRSGEAAADLRGKER